MEQHILKTLDVQKLEYKIRAMYSRVALEPQGEFHFEIGRAVAEKLGYTPRELENAPEEAIESFAGVGHFFGLASLKKGERVLDIGSGSGTDVFIAAAKVGEEGAVTGIDMTAEQLEKAERIRKSYGYRNVNFVPGQMEELPFGNDSFDAVISNGVINLAPDKEKVFREIRRVLKPGGRMAIADIISDTQLPGSIVCSATLWAS